MSTNDGITGVVRERDGFCFTDNKLELRFDTWGRRRRCSGAAAAGGGGGGGYLSSSLFYRQLFFSLLIGISNDCS